jgi:predicted ATPase/class 3 adenylate cyclase
MVTLLLTDIVGSTRLWEQEQEPMRRALELHDRIAQDIIAAHDGLVVKHRGEGDSIFAVFFSPTAALDAAAHLQKELASCQWPTATPLRLRIGVHTGEVLARDQDYYGPVVNRCARIRAAAHPGQTLVSEAVANLTADGLDKTLTLRPLGAYRLKDLLRPEKLFELIIPGAAPGPLPMSLEGVPHNLPVQLTSFVGRQEDVFKVVALLDSARLVTLAGTGGAGKTRLSLQVAAEASDRFPDGVVFVDLSNVTATHVDESIVRAVSETLKLSTAEQTPAQTLQSLATLLVLDNCEHVPDAAAQTAHKILTTCPKVRILATSREPLRIPGEVTYRVESLSLPDPKEKNLDKINESEAVQLFAERCEARLQDFALTEENAIQIAGICRELDGIPLLIEHAAGHISSMSPADMLGRFQDRFRFLRTQDRGVEKRHETLQSTLDWSFDLLTEPEKQLLPLLSIFRAPWDLDETAAVAQAANLDRAQAEDALDGLVLKSLVTPESSSSEARRFRLLVSTRDYAAKKLTKKQSEAAHQALFDHLYRLSEKVAAAKGTPEEAALTLQTAAEISNIEAATDWAIQARDPRCLQAFCNLANCIRHLGTSRTAALIMERAIQEIPTQHQALLATSWNALGVFYLAASLAKAGPAFRKAIDGFAAIGDREMEAGSYTNLGIFAAATKEAEIAESSFAKAMEIYTELGKMDRVAVLLLNVAMFRVDQEKGPEAIAALDSAQDHLAGDSMKAMACRARASAYELMGDYVRCLQTLQEAFRIWSRTMNLPALPGALIRAAVAESKSAPSLRQAKLIGCADGLCKLTQHTFSPRESDLREDILQKLTDRFGIGRVQSELTAGERLDPTAALALALAVPIQS